MNPADRSRLAAAFGRPELARLVAALRRRVELGRSLHGRLVLGSVSEAERAACDALLGRRPTAGQHLSLDLDLLAEGLARAGLCPDLTTAVEVILGPVPNRMEAAARHRDAWEVVWRDAALSPSVRQHTCLRPWLEELRASGLLKRLSDDDPVVASALLADLDRLGGALPAAAEPMAALAARVFGDAHALDPGSPRATLAVRLAARLGETSFTDDAEGRRAAWAGVGVLCDELSSPVIVFQLPASGGTPLGRLLQVAAGQGEPIHVSLRLLVRHPLDDEPALRNRTVFVCENHTVVGLAAQRLGAGCAPMVCVSGQFATPALVLLRQLRRAGAHLKYHGDFDPGGLAIARRVFAEVGAEPWRFGVEDYEAAPPGLPFTGRPGATPWSPALSLALEARRRAVHEEAVFDDLAKDLVAGD